MKTDTLFDIIEIAQDKLSIIEQHGKLSSNDIIIIRDALIEANKMRIALQQISTTNNGLISNLLASDALRKLKY